MASNPTVIRIFRATVKPGMGENFRSFFVNEALPLVKSQEGMLRVTVGLPSEVSPHEFMMISEWDSLESLRKFAGEDWNKAVIDPREAHLISETEVNHYYRLDDE